VRKHFLLLLVLGGFSGLSVAEVQIQTEKMTAWGLPPGQAPPASTPSGSGSTTPPAPFVPKSIMTEKMVAWGKGAPPRPAPGGSTRPTLQQRPTLIKKR